MAECGCSAPSMNPNIFSFSQHMPLVDEEAGAATGWQQIVADVVQAGAQEAPKQDRSRARRAEIIGAAERVFAREGIARARIADIAVEAGVPLSSLYDYFGTKEDIAYAVPQTRMSEFFLEFEAQAKALATSRERLHLFVWLTADFARKHQEWARTLYLEVWPSVLISETPVRKTMDDYGRVMLSLMRQGAADGEWPADPRAYETLNIFIGSTNQLIITWLLYRTPANLMKAVNSLASRLLQLLDEPPDARGEVRPRMGRPAAAAAAAAVAAPRTGLKGRQRTS